MKFGKNKNVFLYTWNRFSGSARLLADKLNVFRLSEKTALIGEPHYVVINWGSSRVPDNLASANFYNPARAVLEASNKLLFFQTMAIAGGPRIPPFTTDRNTVRLWLDDNSLVLARTLLASHSGKGIRMLSRGMEVVEARLYTRYIPKDSEWRIHFINQKIVDIQRKVLPKDYIGDKNFQIRNRDNGFIYIRNDLQIPDDVMKQSQKAMEQCDLHFGAIDVIYNKKREQAYVLEVNTAPGIMGSTVENYCNGFRKMIKELNE